MICHTSRFWHYHSIYHNATLTCNLQERSQPDDLVPLCKYFLFIDCENNQFAKKWIMIIAWNLNSGTKLSGWLRHWLQGNVQSWIITMWLYKYIIFNTRLLLKMYFSYAALFIISYLCIKGVECHSFDRWFSIILWNSQKSYCTVAL